MKILFVVPYVPSLIRARSYNLIRSLSARRNRVVLATLWSSDRDRAALNELGGVCEAVHAVPMPAWRSLLNCVRAFPGSEPLQAAFSWSPELAARVASLQADADVVHVEHLRGVKYGLRARAAGSSPPIVWDSVDCISHLFSQSVKGRSDLAGRLINRVELGRTRRYEGRVASAFDRVVITSPVDRDALIETVPAESRGRVKVSLVPNGVDTDYFSPTSEPRRPRTLIFSGKMSYHANVSTVLHLVNEIMPRIWARMADVELTIVGQSPPARVRKLAATHAPRVIVTGSVPDVRSYLRTATASVVPLTYGAGSQFKVLEAMACGTPVVGTTRAMLALQARRNQDVIVEDEAQPFADAVVDLIGDPVRQREIGQAGRAYVEAHHRWDLIAARLEGVYGDLLAARQPHSMDRVAG